MQIMSTMECVEDDIFRWAGDIVYELKDKREMQGVDQQVAIHTLMCGLCAWFEFVFHQKHDFTEFIIGNMTEVFVDGVISTKTALQQLYRIYDSYHESFNGVRAPAYFAFAVTTQRVLGLPLELDTNSKIMELLADIAHQYMDNYEPKDVM